MIKKRRKWISFGMAVLALLLLIQSPVHALSSFRPTDEPINFWQPGNLSNQSGQYLFGWFLRQVPDEVTPTDEDKTIDVVQSNLTPLDPTVLEKYVDALPIPAVIKSKGINRLSPYYEVTMTQFTQKLHRDLNPTTVWGYNGTYPGPTFEVMRGRPIWVKWINKLPTTHLLPIDPTIHGAQPPNPAVRTVVHLHGGNVPPQSDGFPEDWFTPGSSDTDFYPNQQQAATLWYHDHALGITRLNVYAGLEGFYLLRDTHENLLRLPRGKYEIPMVIQDRSFNTDGSLFYPDTGSGTHPIWVPEFFGDTIVVNGKIWPFLEVEPRKYRFRLLNGSNSRFYNLKLASGQPFYQIGTDGGLLPSPVQVNEILLAPAERADVVVDFSEHAGETILLTNDARTPFPDGDLPDPQTTGQIVQFKVTLPFSRRHPGLLPPRLGPFKKFNERQAIKVRDQSLNEVLIGDEPEILLLNGLKWSDPIEDNPRLGTVEIWRLINLTGDTHPIHLHLVQFQILDRQPFDVAKYKATGELVFTGPAVPPAANEAGWKDTVRANTDEVTRIIMRFADFAGEYVWHCHILEHEDNEMMRPYKVVP